MKAPRLTKGWKPQKKKFRKKFQNVPKKRSSFTPTRRSTPGWTPTKWEIGKRLLGFFVQGVAFSGFLFWLLLL